MQPTAIDSKSKSHPGERVAFIQACWHKEIVDQSRKGFVAEMIIQGYQESDIDFFEVGGAFEIPLHAKLLAESGRYAGIVAAGLVVDGGIYRHEFVAQSVISGLMQVQLETEVPVFSVVLTPHHFACRGRTSRSSSSSISCTRARKQRRPVPIRCTRPGRCAVVSSGAVAVWLPLETCGSELARDGGGSACINVD